MKKEQDQAVLIEQAMRRLKKSRAELADALGVSPALVEQWLASPNAQRHRVMTRPYRLAVSAILAQHRAKK